MESPVTLNSKLSENPLLLSKPSVKVVITGAGGNIGYSLSFLVAQGHLLGFDQPIDLYLSDLPFMKNKLIGLEMELVDSAFPLINRLIITTDDEEAFKDCQVALLVGSKPRNNSMERKDLLHANASIFKYQAALLDKLADINVKICVVGNPANTNALITAEYVTRISKKNITALTRLDHNRALGQMALHLGAHQSRVRNIAIWGNHSNNQFPDPQACEIFGSDNIWKSLSNELQKNWIENTFIPKVQNRGSEIIEMRQLTSAASAAIAICDHVRSWILGTKEGEIVSMGVWSDGNPYGIPNGLIFSFPVTSINGQWSFVPNLKIEDEFNRKMIKMNVEELIEEKTTALEFLERPQ
jgi:malate dehydrogenase